MQPPKIRRFVSLEYIFPNKSKKKKNTDLRNISLTETDRCSSKLSENISFTKTFSHLFSIFRKSTRKSRSEGLILEGFHVSFKEIVKVTVSLPNPETLILKVH